MLLGMGVKRIDCYGLIVIEVSRPLRYNGDVNEACENRR